MNKVWEAKPSVATDLNVNLQSFLTGSKLSYYYL